MKAIEEIGIKAVPVECADGRGYALVSEDELLVNFCAVVADESGNVSHARGSRPAKDQFDIQAEVETRSGDKRAHAPWAFSMLGSGSVGCLMEELKVPHAHREDIADALEAAVAALAESHLPSVDRTAVQALSCSAAKTAGALAFYSGEGERSVRRRQAAAAYPLLAELLAANLSCKMAIDRGKPLADTVAAALSGLSDRQVQKPVLKRVAGSTALPDGCNLETVVRFMTLVPADWIPSGNPEWDAFCNAAHALLEDLGCLDEDVASLVKGCGGKWVEYCGRIAKRAGMDDPDVFRGIRQAMFNASEMVERFADLVILPLAAHAGTADNVMPTPEMLHQARKAALAMLVSGRSGPDLADIQRRWHQESATIVNAARILEEEKLGKIRGEVEEGGWPPLTPAVQAPNGLWLVPLTNPDELKWEGGRSGRGPDGVPGLDHCVGGYAPKAEKCDCHIVSVREIAPDGTYRRVSTVEFGALKADSDTLHVIQNQGQGNNSPGREAKDAVAWYMAAVSVGRVPLNRKLITAFLENRLIPDDGTERICGYDWRDRETLNTAVVPWGPFVVSAFRKLNLDGLMDCKEVADVTALISPEMMMAAVR